MTLSRGDAIPLYHQLFLTLRDEIFSGKRVAGSTVPTEHQLADMYGVSRITARRALDELAGHGLVERRRRTGTRVIFESAMKPIQANLEQTVEALLAFGRETQAQVLELQEVTAPDEVADALRLPEGASVLSAVRLRNLDGEPLGQIVSHIPSNIAAGRIDREVLQSKPILSVIRELGYQIADGSQSVSALSADPILASTLKIEPRAAILQVERVVIGTGDVPLLHTVARYRADRYRISLDLRGPTINFG